MKGRYKAVVIVILVMILLSTPLVGQDQEKKGWGYGFWGAGNVSGGYRNQGFMHYGGGIEILLDRGFGVGMELGYSDADVVMLSAGGLYAFNTRKKTNPFVTAGYTFFLFDEGTANGAFLGGGINHLISNNWGIRVEARDQMSRGSWATRHHMEGRIGVLFSWD